MVCAGWPRFTLFSIFCFPTRQRKNTHQLRHIQLTKRRKELRVWPFQGCPTDAPCRPLRQKGKHPWKDECPGPILDHPCVRSPRCCTLRSSPLPQWFLRSWFPQGSCPVESQKQNMINEVRITRYFISFDRKLPSLCILSERSQWSVPFLIERLCSVSVPGPRASEHLLPLTCTKKKNKQLHLLAH